MVHAVINPGICKMDTIVDVTRIDRKNVKLIMSSICDKVSTMCDALPEVEVYDALKSPMDSKIYQMASAYHLCASCPIPVAIIKAIEVESGLALPGDIIVNLESY